MIVHSLDVANPSSAEKYAEWFLSVGRRKLHLHVENRSRPTTFDLYDDGEIRAGAVAADAIIALARSWAREGLADVNVEIHRRDASEAVRDN